MYPLGSTHLSVRKNSGGRSAGATLRFRDMSAYHSFQRIYREAIAHVRVVPPEIGSDNFGEIVVILKPDRHVILRDQ
jgi:hypothetical protein